MKEFLKHFSFTHFLAFWVITVLLAEYFFAILLPEKFANSPIVTQFTTMAGTVITLVLGFYFGGMAEKNRSKSGEAGSTTASIRATIHSEPKEETINEKENGES